MGYSHRIKWRNRELYYERAIKTKYEEIENLSVPRDRESKFRTAIFDVCARCTRIDELIISQYSEEHSQEKSLKIN